MKPTNESSGVVYDETDRTPLYGSNILTVLPSSLEMVSPGAVPLKTGHQSSISPCLITETFGSSLSVVLDRLSSATDELRQTDNIDTSIQLCRLIRECADTIIVLKKGQTLSSR